MPLVRLLGPVDVVDSAGVVHAPNSSIRCTLLALLALDVGHVLDAEQLLEQAWDNHPPESGRRALRFHISRLRAELCVDDLIVTVGSGYRLDARTDTELVDAALTDTHSTADQLAAVLALWRGQPLADCSHTSAIEHEQQRLAELRLALSEHLYRVRLDTGQASAVIGDLTRLCLDHPLRESLWSILITAHYQADHQAQALRTYDQLRRHLLDELGVDPSPDLQQLEHHILEHHPGLTRNSVPNVHEREHSANNLPRPRDGLVGREDALDQLVRLVSNHRLVTLTGTGGIGKTSLALAVAHHVAGDRGREVWWCDLANCISGEVAFRAGQAIGLTTATADAADIGRALAIRHNPSLIVDNCEHVAAEVAELIDVLLGHGNTTIVATSRLPLPVSDSLEFPVGPLDPQSTAIDMFVAVAAHTSPGFELTVDRALVTSICRRVDGIPLAIELAAARARVLSLADIDRRLARLLDTTPVIPAGVARHNTMTAAIQTSIDLLDSATTSALGDLAVFAGPFDLQAAEAILADNADPLSALDTLTAHSLLIAETSQDVTRYHLLEPIRQYASDHLWADPPTTRNRQLDHYLDRLEAAYETLGTTTCEPLMTLVETDIENLAAAHQWALASERVDDDLRFYQPLRLAWMQGRAEPHRWARETIALAGIEDHSGWAVAWTVAVTGLLLEMDIIGLTKTLERFEDIAPDDPGANMARGVMGYMTGVLRGEWDNPFVIDRSTDGGDTHARFVDCFFGGLTPYLAAAANGNPTDEAAVARSLATLEDGRVWAATIGARHFEAAILQAIAMILIRTGKLDEGVELARRAENISLTIGLRHNATLSSYHQVYAAVLGADIGENAHERLVRLLQDWLHAGHGPGLTRACPLAARLLAANGSHEAAALCMLLPDLGEPDVLPRLAVDQIADEVWRWAERVVQDMSTFDVALRALTDLRSSPVT